MSEKTGARAAVYQKKFIAKPTYKGIVMVDISITFPQVDVWEKPHVSQRISSFYQDSAKKYYEYAAHELYEEAIKEYIFRMGQHFPFNAYNVVQTFEKPYNLAGLLSIYYDRYEYTGGAHGNTVRYADTWHLSSGRRLTLSDFFEDSSYKSVFFEYITAEIKRQIEAGNTYYFDDYVKNVFRYFDEENYYLTDTGFAIYYPLYSIAAYVQGIPVFIVPYEAFGRNLKKRLFE
jgi:hypothetical protein